MASQWVEELPELRKLPGSKVLFSKHLHFCRGPQGSIIARFMSNVWASPPMPSCLGREVTSGENLMKASP